jgi:hypothetical protein
MNYLWLYIWHWFHDDGNLPAIFYLLWFDDVQEVGQEMKFISLLVEAGTPEL